MPLLLERARRGDRPDLEAAGIEHGRHAPDRAALAGGVPALEHDHRAVAGEQVGLLDALQLQLQNAELLEVPRLADAAVLFELAQTKLLSLQDDLGSSGHGGACGRAARFPKLPSLLR